MSMLSEIPANLKLPYLICLDVCLNSTGYGTLLILLYILVLKVLSHYADSLGRAVPAN